MKTPQSSPLVSVKKYNTYLVKFRQKGLKLLTTDCIISFVFYTMEFDNSFLPATVLYKIVLYAIQLYCVSLCPINCMQCNRTTFNCNNCWLYKI